MQTKTVDPIVEGQLIYSLTGYCRFYIEQNKRTHSVLLKIKSMCKNITSNDVIKRLVCNIADRTFDDTRKVNIFLKKKIIKFNVEKNNNIQINIQK